MQNKQPRRKMAAVGVGVIGPVILWRFAVRFVFALDTVNDTAGVEGAVLA